MHYQVYTGPFQAWISPEILRLVDTRIAARRRKDRAHQISMTLNHKIKASLKEDRRQRVAKAVSLVDSLLTSDLPLIREAWIRIRGWYKDAVDRPLPHPEWPSPP